jgi:hypothetical protein
VLKDRLVELDFFGREFFGHGQDSAIRGQDLQD